MKNVHTISMAILTVLITFSFAVPSVAQSQDENKCQGCFIGIVM